jgi:hypothetical protein
MLTEPERFVAKRFSQTHVLVGIGDALAVADARHGPHLVKYSDVGHRLVPAARSCGAGWPVLATI